MTFQAEYPAAIVVEAANYGYGTPNRPKTWCFHTPEEEADDDPQTPGYIAGTTRNASYTYFASYLGFIFQLTPEREGAYANALIGMPAPSWSDGTNLNLQTLSLSFEGYAHNIHLTMLRGGPQWNAAVDLVAHRTKALGLNRDWAVQHKDVSNQRSDCGQFDQAAFIADVKAKMQEDNMALQQTVEAHQEILDNLWDRMEGMEQARDSLVADVAQHRQWLDGHRDTIVGLRDRIKTLENEPGRSKHEHDYQGKTSEA